MILPRREVLNLSAIFPIRTKRRHSLDSSQPKGQHDESPSKAPWRPVYLRRLVIISFFLTFCTIIAALEVLNHISQTQNGLASSVERLHYIWTYTPTAILTIMSALWARTEFQAKQNAPWRSMQEQAQADKSLLLDYDNIPPVALWKSLKHRHFIVSASISCSLILQAAILFSTSLLSLQNVGVQRMDVPIQLEDIFDGNHPTFNDTNMNAFDILNGVQFGNMSYPTGTDKNFAFQRFKASNISQNSVVTVPIQAMKGDLECEHATLKVDQWKVARSNDTWGGNSYQWINNQITTSSCTVFNLTLDDHSTSGWSHYKAMMSTVTCANSTDTDPRRILIYAVQYNLRMVKYHIQDPPTFWTKEYEVDLDHSVQLFCKPRLAFVNMQATANLNESKTVTHLKKVGKEESVFANLNAWNISNEVFNAFSSREYIDQTLGGDRPIADHKAFSDNRYWQKEDSIDFRIQLGAWIAGRTGNTTKLFQNGVLEEVASAFYRSMAAQVIHIGLVKPKVTQTNGSMSFHEDRVLVIQSPLRVLETCMVISALMAVAMIVLRPDDGSLLQNPSNILTIANIMNNSSILQQSLQRAGALSLEALVEKTSGDMYFLTRQREEISIEVDEDKVHINAGLPPTRQISAENRTRQNDPMWKPFPSLWSRISIFCAIAGTIIALEILLRISQRRKGLGEASNDGKMHYLWTSVPSLVMMLLGLLIGSLESNIRVLAPYANLKKAKGVNFGALATNFVDALRITNLLRSTQTRNLAVLSTTLAALITSFLTIVTSGLFSTAEVTRVIEMNFTQQTAFTPPDALSLEEDSPDYSVANYILNNDLDYPKWTYEDLVFPDLSLDTSSNLSMTEGLYADVHVPAIRGSADCLFSTGKVLNYSFSQVYGNPEYHPTGENFQETGDADSPLTAISLHVPTPLNCFFPGTRKSWTNEHDPWERRFYFAADGYFAQMVSSICWAKEAQRNTSIDTPNMFTNLNTYVWGYYQNRTMHHASAMTCTGKIESVDTLTRFELPGFIISPNHPPIPDKSSIKTLPDMGGVWTTYGMDLVDFSASGQRPTAASYNIDNFFTALLEGRYKIPKEYLRDSKYDSKVQEAIKRQERIVKAQPLMRYARVAANGTLDDKPILGNLKLPKDRRVLQDEASTRVLEAMLGLILFFGILGSVLTNTDHVLPKSPTSIAAVGSLLADSNFLSMCGTESNFSNYELLRHYRVRLGWMGDEVCSGSPSNMERPKVNPYFTIFIEPDNVRETSRVAANETQKDSMHQHGAASSSSSSSEGGWI